MKKRRLIITLVWLAGLLLGLGVVEWYVQVPRADGKHVLTSEERLECMKPLIGYYALYLSAMLAVWFVKPFRGPRTGNSLTTAFRLGLVLTLVVNGWLLYMVSQGLWLVGARPVYENVLDGVKLAGLLSFLVAPVNYYFFGIKSTSTQ